MFGLYRLVHIYERFFLLLVVLLVKTEQDSIPVVNHGRKLSPAPSRFSINGINSLKFAVMEPLPLSAEKKSQKEKHFIF